MAFLFYLLGWLSILGGLGWGGYLLYNGITALAPMADPIMGYVNYMTGFGLALIAPGAYLIFTGLLLLAVGGVLSRLDEIAYNTRPMN